ncbi:hypothetical protein PHAVU_002G284100 [Phaseolus vulgaris]|uniref:Uncharacterized protein n=1 Tax=Phaseolus vulgaris TaxID=3885 RepID=V7CPB7_PHAVU|nr:hypothetical protein PHAVU_002G284100g [Phaseolus vulgaris]ESW31989.1 hypothetical protein PHAVU_002G284100g [Phaseolus vulgaris]
MFVGERNFEMRHKMASLEVIQQALLDIRKKPRENFMVYWFSLGSFCFGGLCWVLLLQQWISINSTPLHPRFVCVSDPFDTLPSHNSHLLSLVQPASNIRPVAQAKK